MRARQAGTALDGVAAFGTCPGPMRRALAAHTDVLRPAPGAVLARAGAPAREVVVVVAGGVRLERDGESAVLGPGGAFGGAELLAGAAHGWTATAGPDAELRVVYGPAFLAAAAHLPALAAPVPVA